MLLPQPLPEIYRLTTPLLSERGSVVTRRDSGYIGRSRGVVIEKPHRDYV